MIRRQFLATAGAAALPLLAPSAQAQSNRARFKLRYGPHPGMFRHSAGEDIIDQIKFSADQGFTGWEDNGAMNRDPELQTKIGKTLDQLGMKMGVFVSHADFKTSDFVTRTDKEFQDSLRATMRKAVETAKRLGAKWTTVVPSNVNNKLDPNYQTANCIVNLKVMAEICEPAGLVMVLEPLNWYANHPGLFLRSVPQAYMICKAVGSKSCKILDDLYHQQIDVGNLIPNMEMAWDEIAYIQVGDNPGRKEPTTGEINYKNIFKWLYDRKFDGVIGMEHGNSRPGKEGEMAVIAAYRECDNF
ncbi:MAG: TIM barrel protein [Bryobacteraceae bacterium]|jgi:Hydroxypyruvate isomerase|nr:TIM barrel protein [Bryobacteraceae bacterium]